MSILSKINICIIFFFQIFVSYAQKDTLFHFKIKGAVYKREDVLTKVSIKITDENNRELYKQITGRKGTFSLDLPENNVYLITFEKEGYISKTVSISTILLAKQNLKHKDTKLSFNCRLTKKPKNINEEKLKLLQEPFAIISYDETQKNLVWDKEYTKKMTLLERDVLKSRNNH